jgi:hydroxymethylpyrimidine pyrophosphatase-like HAD family hydrolase
MSLSKTIQSPSLTTQKEPRIVVFSDLDDTLLQTKPKISATSDISIAATDKQGEPLSFFTAPQKKLLQLFELGNALIIPVTGRNSDALNRVHYSFSTYKITSHGAIVFNEKNQLCQQWITHIEPYLRDNEKQLYRLNKEVETIIHKHHLDARTRVIIDQNIPVYVSIKGALSALNLIKKIQTLPPSFTRHENGRNHALLPAYANKKDAVKYVYHQLSLNENDLTIALGDSLSDLPFMNECYYSMTPQKSQIARVLFNE